VCEILNIGHKRFNRLDLWFGVAHFKVFLISLILGNFRLLLKLSISSLSLVNKVPIFDVFEEDLAQKHINIENVRLYHIYF